MYTVGYSPAHQSKENLMSLGKFLFGGEGEAAQDVFSNNKGLNILKNQGQAASSPELAKALAAYSSGGMSLQDAIASAQGGSQTDFSAQEKEINAKIASMGIPDKGMRDKLKAQLMAGVKASGQNTSGDMSRSISNQFFTDPLTGSKVAAEQVQSNPLLSGMFGQDGLMGQRQAEESDLASRGYNLQAEDHDALGQANDMIARQSSMEEGALARALQSRGLAQGASGAAGAGFSGLMGNKFERLAGQQKDIAMKRMESTRARLQDLRQINNQTNQLAQGALNDQYTRNASGVENYQNTLKGSVEAAAQQQNQVNNAFAQKDATSSGGIIGGALGMGLGALTGGAGSALGKAGGTALGNALGGGKKTI